MLNSMIASADQGDDDYARLYESELRLARMRKLLELQTLREEALSERNGASDGAKGKASGDGPGLPPQVLPEAFVRPPSPPDSKPTDGERLEALGLVGPGG